MTLYRGTRSYRNTVTPLVIIQHNFTGYTTPSVTYTVKFMLNSRVTSITTVFVRIYVIWLAILYWTCRQSKIWSCMWSYFNTHYAKKLCLLQTGIQTVYYYWFQLTFSLDTDPTLPDFYSPLPRLYWELLRTFLTGSKQDSITDPRIVAENSWYEYIDWNPHCCVNWSHCLPHSDRTLWLVSLANRFLSKCKYYSLYT